MVAPVLVSKYAWPQPLCWQMLAAQGLDMKARGPCLPGGLRSLSSGRVKVAPRP
jgi:hypothetical protein